MASGIFRFSKSRLPKNYVTCSVINSRDLEDNAVQNNTKSSHKNVPRMIGWQAIASDDLVSEFMLNALRLHDGVTWELFETRTGLSRNCIAAQVNRLIGKGLLLDSLERLQATVLGQRYLNQILREFL